MCNLGDALVMETWEKAVRATRKENKKKIMEANKRAEDAEKRADKAKRELEELRKLLAIVRE